MEKISGDTRKRECAQGREQQIVTEFWAKPIPDRRFDWQAVFDNYDLGSPIGYGATEQAAVADLLDLAAD